MAYSKASALSILPPKRFPETTQYPDAAWKEGNLPPQRWEWIGILSFMGTLPADSPGEKRGQNLTANRARNAKKISYPSAFVTS
jgi:hypothetical protein